MTFRKKKLTTNLTFIHSKWGTSKFLKVKEWTSCPVISRTRAGMQSITLGTSGLRRRWVQVPLASLCCLSSSVSLPDFVPIKLKGKKKPLATSGLVHVFHVKFPLTRNKQKWDERHFLTHLPWHFTGHSSMINQLFINGQHGRITAALPRTTAAPPSR